METDATIATTSAKRYLGQFVKHFAHKLPFALLESNETGEVRFPFGLCTLSANTATLRITLTTQADEQMATLQDVVAKHLVRFAFRETLPIEWRSPT